MRKPILEKEIKSPLKVGGGVDIVDEEILDEIVIGEAREETQVEINPERKLKVVPPSKEAPGKILQGKARGRVMRKPQYPGRIATEILEEFALRTAHNTTFQVTMAEAFGCGMMSLIEAKYRESLEEQARRPREVAHAVYNVTARRARQQEASASRLKELFGTRTADVMYSAACPEAVVHVEDYRIRALLDGGSEVNVMDKAVAESLGLAVSPCREISLIDANTGEVSIEGIIENVPISIGAVTVVQAFLVMGRTSKPLILGTPFMAATRFQAEHSAEGAIEVTLTDPRNGRQVVFAGASHSSRRNKKLSNIPNNKWTLAAGNDC